MVFHIPKGCGDDVRLLLHINDPQSHHCPARTADVTQAHACQRRDGGEERRKGERLRERRGEERRKEERLREKRGEEKGRENEREERRKEESEREERRGEEKRTETEREEMIC